MKPVLILQHLTGDGPAYLATWLHARGLVADVRNTQAGDAYPERLDGYGALAILGGEMSANDPLPSLRRAEALFREALASNVPTLGHCLGGQLMARALGAAITASPAPEVGWQPLQVDDSEPARAWFGAPGERTVFHWHYESFGLPPGALWLARSEACPHQAFALGPHLAMQFHVEVDAEKIGRWKRDADRCRAEVPEALRAAMQSETAMLTATGQHLTAQQRLADRIYERWIAAAVGR